MCESHLRESLSLVYEEIGKALCPNDDSPEDFYQSMQYAMGWTDERFRPVPSSNAKMLRPRLCLLSCMSVGADARLAVPAAAAVELLHNFTLVHDDIQDKSLRRRYRPSLWRLTGVPLAINSGDGMFAAAHIPLYSLVNSTDGSGTLVKALREFDKAALGICEGQHLDISFEARRMVSSKEYLRMIRRKTGVLMGLSCYLGALAADADTDQLTHFRAFGENVGIAYQIRDDLMSVWQEEKSTGKRPLEDIYSRKKSYPAVRAFEMAEGDDADRLREIYVADEVSEDDALWVRGLMTGLGIRDEGITKVKECARVAMGHLDQAGVTGEAFDGLRRMAEGFTK